MAESSVLPPVAQGAVYLVGAGPGAVGTLTVRALEVLSSCDVVLHDRLVPLEVVRLAKPSAEVRYVGKDAGVKTEKMKGHQDEISAQLVELARRGLSVCRLKGGDPMIFGRAGEEMEQLAAAGVPYEVVPAVTAALAAAADARIPLTFRNTATSLHVCTMNSSTTSDESFDWAQFKAPMTTFAFYMGLSALAGVCERLLAVGVAGSTPMAVVDRASLREMQVVTGTVDTLPAAVSGRGDLKGPALVLLGRAVAMREQLLGLRPEAPVRSDLAHLAAVAALPAMSDDALKDLRARVEEQLARRSLAAREKQASPVAEPQGDVAEPPAKRSILSEVA